MSLRFPKVFHVGHRSIAGIFDGVVEITEKVDGSQFGFGKPLGELYTRSRGRTFDINMADKMFNKACQHVLKIQDKIPNGYMFYGEVLNSVKHNTLTYDRVPKNHIVLFGMTSDDPDFEYSYSELALWAWTLGVDVVPVLYEGIIESPQNLHELLDRESYLGGPKIEGIVVKNWNKVLELGGEVWPFMCGKLVSAEFREKHERVWKTEKVEKSAAGIGRALNVEARFLKAVQRVRENGEEPDLRHIGQMVIDIHNDIIEEELDWIKDKLWAYYSREILRESTRGFAEWFKGFQAYGEFNAEE